MELTLTVPDELANRLRAVEDRLPEIIEIGLREWLSNSPGYNGLAEVLETLARLPSPEEVIGLRPSTHLQERIEELLAKNRDEGLSAEEQREWERYEYVEHLVRLAKGRALHRQVQRERS
jgi:hypothetical protein